MKTKTIIFEYICNTQKRNLKIMKRLVRALVGILATIIIVILIERTMINFEFFPEDDTTTADSIAVAQSKQDSLVEKAKTAINPVIKAKDLLSIADNKQMEAGKIYKKEVSFEDSYMTNLVYKDTIPNYSDVITVSFDFENDDFYENVLFIVFDCLDNQSSKLIKRFYQPVSNVNRVKLNKGKLSDGLQTFRVGYFLKKEASKSRVIFYNKELKIYLEE